MYAEQQKQKKKRKRKFTAIIICSFVAQLEELEV